MSLDLYLRTAKERPVKHRRGDSQGNYSESGGFTRALSREEILELWPNFDVSQLPDPNEEYEDNELWWANITHNLTEMASHVPVLDEKYDLYKLLWHPGENGFSKVTKEYQTGIEEGLIYLVTHKTELEKFNPENGWGNYDLLVDFVKSYLTALSSYPYLESDLEIYASV